MKIGQCNVSLVALASEIYDAGQYLKRNFTPEELAEPGSDFSGTDCRLQVREGTWQLHTGSSDYDQDHRGAWGADCIPRACTRKEARDIARRLAEEAANDYAMGNDD